MAKKKTRKAAGPPEPSPSEKRRATRIYKKLEQAYPDAHCALVHRDAWELLVATILSAQCTDANVNKATPALFERFPGPAEMAKATPADIEPYIRTLGLFRNKAKSLQGAAAMVMDEFDGSVPDSMEELVRLPGVARKTANVVLGNAFDINVGVVVDTHIRRLSQRLGFTEQSDVKKIEQDLMARFPQKNWTMLAHLLIAHGRACCTARKPDVDACPLGKDCCNGGEGKR